MENECVFSEVGAKYLYIIQINLSLQDLHFTDRVCLHFLQFLTINSRYFSTKH